VLDIRGEYLHAILRLTGNALAGRPQIEQCQVNQRQTAGSYYPGNHRVAGYQRRCTDPTITNGRGDNDAEHQCTERIHGQIALQEALHERRLAIAVSHLANLSSRSKRRSATQHQQGGQQYRGDEFTNAIDQASGIECQEQHRRKIHQRVDQQGLRAIANERHHAHLERHYGSARCCEERADCQVDCHGQQATGHLAQRCSQAIHPPPHTRQCHHGQQGQADPGKQKAQCGLHEVFPCGQPGAGRENDIASPEEQGKGHKAKGQQVLAAQLVHKR